MNSDGVFQKHIKDYAEIIKEKTYIDPSLYDKYNVKRGLRNQDGTGVLVGITQIGDVKGYEYINGTKTPVDGDLTYRGYSLLDITSERGFRKQIFEEISYLLLFDKLPTEDELKVFREVIFDARKLPEKYLEDVILKIPSNNIMNQMQRAILALYNYDESPDDTDTLNIIKQSLGIIAKIPIIMSYSYQAKKHYIDGKSLVIHYPKREYTTAENILHLIRDDSKFTEEEAELLDIMLVLHAEHGGGNNSAFATHVVSSSGTDTYSVMATALGSLKGPRHGGANIKVMEMLENISSNISDEQKEEEIKGYLEKILAKQVFDKKGLIYGIGHAVYTVSDPRTTILKQKAYDLCKIKGFEKEFSFLEKIEKIGGKLIQEKNNLPHPSPANVDLYSGLIYQMLDIPVEVYTPLFAVARTAGWCAHRLEQIMDTKIIRPAYMTLNENREYINKEDR